MTKVKNTTKAGQAIINTFNNKRWHKGSIYEAYNNPSSAKKNAYYEIECRAYSTDGYNHDLTVVGASSHFFSTMYSYTDEQGTHIVYDTHSDTKVVDIA